MDSAEGMVEKRKNVGTKLILHESKTLKTRQNHKTFDPDTLVTFFDFCALMGYTLETSIQELYSKSSEMVVLDPKPKIKRSNSMRL